MAEKEKGKWWEDIRLENLLNPFAMYVDANKGAMADLLPDAIKDVLNKVTGWLSGVETGTWDNLFDFYIGAGLLKREQAEQLMKLKESATPLDWIYFITISMRMFFTYLETNTQIGSNFLSQGLNKAHRSNLPGPGEVIGAAFIAPEKTGEVREICKRLGYKDTDIDLLFLSHYRLYDEGNIRTLWLRGVLNDDQMFMRMRELGFTDTRIREIVQGWSVIPGPQDLFHLVAKEAFEPDMIERMGYADEFPLEQVEWLRKQGISEEWAKKYWYAHWETPSIQAGYEMLHREDPDRPGQNIIDKEELDMLFRTVEIPPYWRDKLTKIAYTPYTRVDVRRMHDMGVLNDKQLVRAYLDLGFDEEHATNMAKFTIRYNQQNDKELTKSQILNGYKEKILSKEDTRGLLIDIDYPEDLADYLILMEDYKESKSLQDELLTNIKDRFQNRFADEFETRSKLGQLNLSGERIAILMDKWKIKRLIDVKFPSKADLDKFLKNKVIEAGVYRDEMDKLGYNTKYIEWYEKLSIATGGK